MKLETNDVSHLEWMYEEVDKENKYEKPWKNGSLRVTKNGRYFCCGGYSFFLDGRHRMAFIPPAYFPGGLLLSARPQRAGL